ncbi:MAG: ECF-type sigma factor [Acidobacteriota bacterium]
MTKANEITQWLKRARNGDAEAEAELLAYVYPNLKRIAASRLRSETPGHGLQVTELVNEAYVRVFGSNTPVDWQNRAHFFAVIAQAVRNILVDHARRRQRGGHVSVALDDGMDARPAPEGLANIEVVALDEALRQFESIDARAARVVLLRFFGGLTLEEAAEVLSVSVVTVKRDWAFAKSWLFDQLKPGARPSPSSQ